MRTVILTAPTLKAATVAARNRLGLPRTKVIVNDGCENNYRVTFPSGDVAEALIIPRRRTDIVGVV